MFFTRTIQCSDCCPFFKSLAEKNFVGVVRLFRIFCCSSTIIVFRRTDHISNYWYWDSSAFNIVFAWSDEMSFVHAFMYSTYVFVDGRLKVSAMIFCFPGLL